MAKLIDILNTFESSFQDGIPVKASISLELKEPMPLSLVKWDSKRPFFQGIVASASIDSNEKNAESVNVQSFYLYSDLEIPIEPIDPPSFNYIFWISKSEDSEQIELHYLECGKVTPLDSLDIAIGDTYNASTKRRNFGKFKELLASAYVFDAGVYKLLLAKTFNNGSLDWQTYGLNTTKDGHQIPVIGTIVLGKNPQGDPVREIVQESERRQFLFKRIEDIEILAYSAINFVDMSVAREAKDSLNRRLSSGDAILTLWKSYNDIELAKAQKRSDDLGNVSYTITKRGSNGNVLVKFDLSKDQSEIISNIAGGHPMLSVNGTTKSFKMLRYDVMKSEAVFDDEEYGMPSTGKMRLSTMGEVIVSNRRNQALKTIFKFNNVVLTNLHFAIEGEVSSMIVKKHNEINPLSAKTKEFLKRRFHIENLTPNQQEAVNMAINNQEDITIIQGPPGTGKTTVVAAICYRLLELAQKKVSKIDEKIILASAFQNDATEHMSSKIYSYGLPTPKIGQTKSAVNAEDIFVKEKIEHINKKLEELGGKLGTQYSSQIMKIHDLFVKEGDYDASLIEVNRLIQEGLNLSADLFAIWVKIKQQEKKDNTLVTRLSKALSELKTDEQSYNFEDGFMAAYSLLHEDAFKLSESEKQLLESAPDMDPSEEFLSKLTSLKTRLESQVSDIEKHEDDRRNQDLTDWLLQTAEYLKAQEQEATDDEDRFIQSVLSELESDLHNNSQYIKSALQEYSEVIAATNQLAGSSAMQDFSVIHNVILDEAARSNPLDLIIPMSKANDRIILVGDQKQLPHLLEPTISEESLESIEDIDQRRESRELYAKPLFGILFDNVKNGNRPRCITLNEQFRMHPTIGEFISDVYYEGKLKPGREGMDKDRQHGLSLPWAIGKTFVFCHVGHDGNKDKEKGRSKFRVCEAQKAIQLLKEIESDKAFENLSIGIISFYAKQVETIFEEAAKYGYAYQENGEYLITDKYKELPDGREKLRIGSVDAFQGKEFDIVILSTVRSNDIPREPQNAQRVFGFLTIPNRLNVAFSRAQRMVITIGDENMYKDEYARENVPGLYKLCNEIIPNKEYGIRI